MDQGQSHITDEAPDAARYAPRGAGRRRVGRAGAWAAALLLAGVSVVVGCRAADRDAVTPVPQLLAFLPWLTVPTAAALLLALFSRWRTGLVWGVAVLGALAWYLQPYGEDGGEPDGAPVSGIRVLASNVQFSRGTNALIDTVTRHRPDIVFVEECGRPCRDALDRESLRTRYPYRRAVAADGSAGSTILSTFPLKAAPTVAGTMGMPAATADVRGHPVRLQLAHPMPPLADQVGVWRTELGRLADAARGTRGSQIMAGDFNATQDHAAFRRILDAGALRDAARRTGHARTPSWPATAPGPLGTQIDHVLATPDFSADKSRFLDLADTDHRALLVDLTLHG
ncbi:MULTISPECIES: endonuclease/exonuclease/phosphatase family protein [unclassified Streptomyces]|uniref:endonuclease/exonuclease/phosphatase family protein n=1 Tax=unclassified Streptomyces TaxID=2593676 RepID=UPI00278BF5FA|nr:MULTISPECIES: endonuclease/exonuclease/phosphatase family protein [unclassified Streptomyces]